MIRIFLILILLINCEAKNSMDTNINTIYDFEVKDIRGKTISLSQYKGKVMLIVNTASKCGFTPQYGGLEKLYNKYKNDDNGKGLVILGFPSNQFMEQEPASNDEIAKFCRTNFSIAFPIFSKIDVNGDDTEPLYKYLKSQASGFLGSESIKWNFTKFLIDSDGKVIDRYSPMTKPKDIEDDIKKLLN